MALASSGALSLSEIQAEFGGSNPISISEYYAAATGVPASGEIAVTDFYGTSAIDVSISDGEISDVQGGGGLSTAKFQVNTNGTITTSGNASSYSDTTWHLPTSVGIGSSYQIRVTATGDTGSLTGTLNTWQTISSFRAWQLSTSSTQRSVALAVSIRDVATETVQDTASISIIVESGF